MERKNFSVVVTDEAQKIISDYMKQHECSRNKAVNDLIVYGGTMNKGQDKALDILIKSTAYIHKIAKSLKSVE